MVGKRRSLKGAVSHSQSLHKWSGGSVDHLYQALFQLTTCTCIRPMYSKQGGGGGRGLHICPLSEH